MNGSKSNDRRSEAEQRSLDPTSLVPRPGPPAPTETQPELSPAQPGTDPPPAATSEGTQHPGKPS